MSHRWRRASDVATNAPLRVPTNTRTPLIAHSFLGFAPGARRSLSPPGAAARPDLLTGQAGDLHDRPNLHRPQGGARKPSRVNASHERIPYAAVCLTERAPGRRSYRRT